MTRVASHENTNRRAPRFVLGHLSKIKPKASVNVDSDRRRATTTVTIVVTRNGLSGAKAAVHLRQSIETLVENIMESRSPAAEVGRLAQRVGQAPVAAATERVRTKAPKSTISVNSSDRLWDELAHHASEVDSKVSPIAVECFEKGLESLSARLWKESPKAVLAELSAAYTRHFEGGEAKQWSLRLSRKTYLDAVLLAQEQEISLSLLACMCLVSGLETCVLA